MLIKEGGVLSYRTSNAYSLAPPDYVAACQNIKFGTPLNAHRYLTITNA